MIRQYEVNLRIALDTEAKNKKIAEKIVLEYIRKILNIDKVEVIETVDIT